MEKIIICKPLQIVQRQTDRQLRAIAPINSLPFATRPPASSFGCRRDRRLATKLHARITRTLPAFALQPRRSTPRSNSARPPKTVSISRPCAVVVSAHVPASDRKRAPFGGELVERQQWSRVLTAPACRGATKQHRPRPSRRAPWRAAGDSSWRRLPSRGKSCRPQFP